jgi:hypothetical protein
MIAWLPAKTRKREQRQNFDEEKIFDLQQTSHLSPPKTRVKQHSSLQT